jgi:hypothetical protein
VKLIQDILIFFKFDPEVNRLKTGTLVFLIYETFYFCLSKIRNINLLNCHLLTVFGARRRSISAPTIFSRVNCFESILGHYLEEWVEELYHITTFSWTANTVSLPKRDIFQWGV